MTTVHPDSRANIGIDPQLGSPSITFDPDKELNQLTNFLFDIVDPSIQQQWLQFTYYLSAKSIYWSYVIMIFFGTALGIDQIYRSFESFTYSFAFATVLWAIAMFNAVLMFTHPSESYQQESEEEFEKRGQRHKLIRSLIWLLLSLWLSCHNILIAVEVDCSEYKKESYSCAPLEQLILPLVIAVFHNVVLKGTEFRLSLLMWCSGAVTVVFALLYQMAFRSMALGTIYLVLTYITLILVRRDNLVAFLASKKLKEALDDHHRQADAKHAGEMRSMIANVAHDLKTPLASLLSGMEMIELIVNSLIEDFPNSNIDSGVTSRVRSNSLDETMSSNPLRIIDKCVQNMKHTNSFMLMTINRCIDYTKASKGVQLKASYDTVDVMEALRLPLECMQDMQNKVTIKFIVESDSAFQEQATAPDQAIEDETLSVQRGSTQHNSAHSKSEQISIASNVNYAGNSFYSIDSNFSEAQNTNIYSFSYRLPTVNMSKFPEKASKILGEHNLKFEKICSFIITDKQWLQENIFCLLSNAVKYSAGGEVIVRTFLETAVEVFQKERAERQRRRDLNSKRSALDSLSTESSNVMHGSRANAPPTQRSLSHASTAGVSVSWEEKSISMFQSKAEGDEEVEVDHNTKFLTFEVEDTGIGLANEAMANLFSPFKQAQRLAGGTGLGLYSLRKRIEALKGKCGVRRRRDQKQGSLFWFSIPYRPDENSEEMFGGDGLAAAAEEYKRSLSISDYKHLASSLLSSSNIAVNNALKQQKAATPRKIETVAEETRHDLENSANNTFNNVHEHHQNTNVTTIFINTAASSISNTIISVEISKEDDHTTANHTADNTAVNTASNTTVNTAVNTIAVVDQRNAMKPAMPAITRSNSQSRAGQKRTALEYVGGRLRILVVDDSPAILKMTSMMLRMHKHDVTAVENGAEALSKVENMFQLLARQAQSGQSGQSDGLSEGVFDVVLMDLQMPVMDGLEATKRMRALERTYLANLSSEQSAGQQAAVGQLVIIGVSANSDYETEELARAAGMSSFICKPFSINSFYEKYKQLTAK